jgi:hypothetical protein
MGGESLVPIILEGLSSFFSGGHCDGTRELLTQDITPRLGGWNVISVIEGPAKGGSQKK